MIRYGLLALVVFFAPSIHAENCVPEIKDKRVVIEYFDGKGNLVRLETHRVRSKKKYDGMVSNRYALDRLKKDKTGKIKVKSGKFDLKSGGITTRISRKDGGILAKIGGCPVSKLKFYDRIGKEKSPFIHRSIIAAATTTVVAPVASESVKPSQQPKTAATEPQPEEIRQSTSTSQATPTPKAKPEPAEVTKPATNKQYIPGSTPQLVQDSVQTQQGYMGLVITQDGFCDSNTKINVTYKLKRHQTLPFEHFPKAIKRGVERMRARCPAARTVDVLLGSNNWTLGSHYFRASAAEGWRHRPLKQDELFGMAELPAMPEEFEQFVEGHESLGIFRPKNPRRFVQAYHTAVCSERMGVLLVFWDLNKGYSQADTSIINDYSHDVIPALVNKCPQVKVADARLVGPDLNPLTSQAFSKARGWKRDPQADLGRNAPFSFQFEGGREAGLIGIYQDRFHGEYWGIQWGKLEGTLAYPARDYKVQGVRFSGNWYEHGTTKQRCETSREGFAYWGKLQFDVEKDGSTGVIKRTACSDADDLAVKGEPWLQIRGVRGAEHAQEFVRVSNLAQAQLQQDQLKLQAANSGAIPKTGLNPLAHFGYPESKQVFQHEGVEYYVTSKGNFAAVKDIGDDEPILDLDPKTLEYDGKSLVGYSLSEKALEEMQSTILPALQEHAGTGSMLIINYYTGNKDLKSSKEMQSSNRLRVEPPIRVVFRNYEGSWKQEVHSKKRPWSNYVGYANTVRQAMAIRAERDVIWNERVRVANLTPQQKAQETLTRLDGRDNKLRDAAAKSGTVFRDWRYWHQYNNGKHLAGIFFGDYDAETWAGLFPHLYLRFFGAYSLHCKALIPKGSPGYDYYTTTTTTSYGSSYFKDEFTRYDGSIRVKQKYWPPFERYHQDPPTGLAGPAMQAGLSGNLGQMFRSINSMVNFYTAINQDFDLMFRVERCDGGFIRQMADNLYHAATNSAYVQKQGKKMNYAAGDTGGKSTVSSFYISCIVSEGLTDDKKRWCKCLDRGSKKAFSRDDRARYANNYLLLIEDTRYTPRSTGGAEWRRYDMVQQCKN